MLTCREIAENASEYISSDTSTKLTIKQKFEFTLHKMMCSRCRRFMYYFETLYSSESRLSGNDIPDSQVDIIINKIKVRKI